MSEKTAFSESQKNEIISKLTTRMPNLHCPMCGKNHFTIMEGYFTSVLQSDLNSLQLTGMNMPTVALVCNNCGFVSYHSLGALGLLPNTDKTDAEK